MLENTLMPASRQLLLVLIGLSIALMLSLAPAWSLDSGWAETEGGRMRMVVDPAPRDDGTIAGFLDVALDPGWKTYWRDPGSAGIPPLLDFSQNKGIAFERMDYPAPVRVDDGYAIWAGYTRPVQFPLVFRRTASGQAQIHTQAFIGICEKVCVPFQAELIVDLPADISMQDPAKSAVEDAFARLPETPGADFSIDTAVLETRDRQLTISAKLPAFRPSGVAPELFVAGPQGFAFAPPELITDNQGLAEWSVRVDQSSEAAVESGTVPLDIVVTLGQRAISQTVSVNISAGD